MSNDDDDEKMPSRDACKTCGSTLWARMQFRFVDGQSLQTCDMCALLPYWGAWMPDAFTGPGGGIKTDENLAWRSTGNPEVDAKFEGKPIPYSTKREKALAMKLSGVRQADSAEHQHGSRNESHLHRKKYFFT